MSVVTDARDNKQAFSGQHSAIRKETIAKVPQGVPTHRQTAQMSWRHPRYTYDKNGNTLTKVDGTTSYTWDLENHALCSVQSRMNTAQILKCRGTRRGADRTTGADAR